VDCLPVLGQVTLLFLRSARLLGDGWFASLFIYYSKGPQNILVTFAVPDSFKTYGPRSGSKVDRWGHNPWQK